MTTPFVPIYRQFPVEDKINLEKQLVNFHIQSNQAINNREIALYNNNSVQTGQKWNDNQGNSYNGFRIVLYFSSILNGTTTIAHGISYKKITALWGTADNGTTTIPLEHSTSTEAVSLTVNSTNVVITTTTANWTAYSGRIVLEYY